MKLKFIFLIFFFIFIFPTSISANELEIKTLVDSQLNQLDTNSLENTWNKAYQEYEKYFGYNSLKFSDLLHLTDQGGFSIKAYFQAIFKYLFYEIIYNGKLLGTIIVLTVLSIILQYIQSSFEETNISKLGYTIIFLVLIVLVINSFSSAITYAKESIQQMTDIMIAILPLLFALLTTNGNLVTVAVFHPLIVFMIYVVGFLINYLIFPLLFFSAILYLVSLISNKYSVTQLATLLKSTGLSLLGFFFTIFMTIISIEGATTAVTDGITLRTAKYVTNNFIPVVGKMFSDAADTVMGVSLLAKNAIGVAGLFIILIIVTFPALKILSLIFIYKFSAAILQPLGQNPIIDALSLVGKNISYIFAALAIVSLMFFMALIILITIGNVSLMLR